MSSWWGRCGSSLSRVKVRVSPSPSPLAPTLALTPTLTVTLNQVGSPWGLPSKGRHNYTILASSAVHGRVGSWTQYRALFSGQAEYSTMAVPSADNDTLFVLYERGQIYGGHGTLRLTQLALPLQLPLPVRP